jgi:hypothetical protein
VQNPGFRRGLWDYLTVVGTFFSQLRAHASGGAIGGAAPQRVDAPWQTLVLVCSKCRGARKGPDQRDIRKGLKQRLGKNKRLRVLESECLSLCPDDAVTVCIARTDQPTELRIIQSCDELDGLAALIQPA